MYRVHDKNTIAYYCLTAKYILLLLVDKEEEKGKTSDRSRLCFPYYSLKL